LDDPPSPATRMKIIDRINLTLGLLLLALLGAQLGLQRKDAGPAVWSLSPQAVQEIRVLRDGQLTLDLLRDQDGWMLTHPSVERADARRVATLLGLTRLHALQRLDDVEPQNVGLQPPRLQLQFDDSELAFGDASVPAGLRYVRVGERIYLVDDLAYRIASLPAQHYREAR
jgi:hypothetical protein